MPARKKLPEHNDSLSFEDTIISIEEIVNSMEGEQLPLEDIVTQYEKGSMLLKHCESVLSSARKRIELITLANREESGQQTSKSAPTSTPSEIDGVSDESNDINLFWILQPPATWANPKDDQIPRERQISIRPRSHYAQPRGS